MDLKASTEGARMTIRDRAWNVQDRCSATAWSVEEGVFKRTAPIVRGAQWRVSRRIAPVQRAIQTKLLWPVLDAVRQRTPAARIAIASAAVILLLGAGTARSFLNSSPEPATALDVVAASALPAAPVPVETAGRPLQGVTPDFNDGEAVPAVAGKAVPVAVAAPLTVEADPKAPAGEIANHFAQAFVAYEVGKADDRTAAAFAAVAEAPLAKALAEDPPRLPSAKGVPEAQVLNVVLGEREGQAVEASVSLVRLKAASELRLTLRRTPEDGWRVAEVLG